MTLAHIMSCCAINPLKADHPGVFCSTAFFPKDALSVCDSRDSNHTKSSDKRDSFICCLGHAGSNERRRESGSRIGWGPCRRRPPPYTPWLLPVVGQLNVFVVGVQTAFLGLQTLASLQYEPASGWLCHWCNGLGPIRIGSLRLYRCYPTQGEQNWRE